MISAVVLAAGSSSRMGTPKALVRLHDKPILAHVVAAVQGSRVGQVVVVLGHEADRVVSEVPLDGATVVVNRDFTIGMSTSIRAGLRAADPNADGARLAEVAHPVRRISTAR